MSMQKRKGKTYENKIADYIHKFLYTKIADYKKMYDSLGNVNLKPRREKSSGTSKEADNDIDLGIAMKFFPYSVECKHHKVVTEVTLNGILNAKFSWIDKVYKQAETHGRIKKLIPLVIFKGNRTIDFCCMSLNDIKNIIINKIPTFKIPHYIIYDSRYFLCALEDIMTYLVKEHINE